MRLGFLAFAIALLVGCGSNPGIVRLSPDTYMLSREDHAGVFGSASALKARVIREANAFAESQGKVAVPLSASETPVGGPGQWASFTYQFRVVDKDDPEAQRTSLVPRPDVVIERTDNVTANVAVENPSAPKDTYTELLRLDDLRKRGILTDAEFEREKAKLLSAD